MSINGTMEQAENGHSPSITLNSLDETDRVYWLLLELLKPRLPELADYVESNALHIVKEFKQLSSQSLQQCDDTESVLNVARTLKLDGEEVPYEKSIEILYQPLSESIEKILQVSKMAMSMVMMIGNAAENISRVEECIGQVQALTKQTNMLAMNTQIEAARAGESGASFNIIAQEVKGLSESIKQLSQQMFDDVTEVAGSVKKASQMVDELANYDMTENLMLKTKIDDLIDSIMTQNKQFGDLIEGTAKRSKETADSIAGLVMGIQFQDRTSQIIGDLMVMLEEAMKHFANQSHAGGAKEAVIDELLNEVKLSEVRNQLAQILNEHGILSDESEYVKPVLVSSNGHDVAASDDDGDDIELF